MKRLNFKLFERRKTGKSLPIKYSLNSRLETSKLSKLAQPPDTSGLRRQTSSPDPNIHPRREESPLAINTDFIPKFQVANIESLISRKARQQKIPFLREQCNTEKPYFLTFAETHLTDDIIEAEFNITGYSHETSNRVGREGGGVIIYINNNLTYKTLISDSDEMCIYK